MAQYKLECDCGSDDFEYYEDSFHCVECGLVLPESVAGHHLLENE